MDEPRFPGYRPSRSCSGSGGPGSATTNARDTVVADHVRWARRPFRPDAARLVKAEVVKGRNAGYYALRSRLLPDRRRGRGCAPRGNAGGAAAAFRDCFTTSSAYSAHTIPTLWKPGWNSPSAGTIRWHHRSDHRAPATTHWPATSPRVRSSPHP